MPFRERVKRALGRSNGDSSDNASLTKTDSRRGSNVQHPGEAMPQAKYRQPVDKKHKETLEAFSFMGNWRKSSYQSQYSPMGSQIPSRRNSVMVEPDENISNGPSHTGQMLGVAGDDEYSTNGLSRQPSKNVKPRSIDFDRGLDKHANDTSAGVVEFIKAPNGAVHEHNSSTDHYLSNTLEKTRLQVP